MDSYKLAIGWGVVNALASVWAYFLVENKEELASNNTECGSDADEDDLREKPCFEENTDPLEDDVNLDTGGYDEDELAVNEAVAKRASVVSARVAFKDDVRDCGEEDEGANKHPMPDFTTRRAHQQGAEAQFEPTDNGKQKYFARDFALKRNSYLEGQPAPPRDASARSSIISLAYDENAPSETHTDGQLYDFENKMQFRGRRFLLLTSLGGGAVTLLITSLCFLIPKDNSARLPVIAMFIMIFTIFYSVGAGAIPFLYCAEVFPNEGREIGMSWSTFWNFFGVGILLLFVSFGINFSHGKLLGIFAGLNLVAFILVSDRPQKRSLRSNVSKLKHCGRSSSSFPRPIRPLHLKTCPISSGERCVIMPKPSSVAWILTVLSRHP